MMTNKYELEKTEFGTTVNGVFHQWRMLETVDGETLIVAQESLENVLLNETTRDPVDQFASELDNGIFFYAPDDLFGDDNAKLIQHMNKEAGRVFFVTAEQEVDLALRGRAPSKPTMTPAEQSHHDFEMSSQYEADDLEERVQNILASLDHCFETFKTKNGGEENFLATSLKNAAVLIREFAEEGAMQ